MVTFGPGQVFSVHTIFTATILLTNKISMQSARSSGVRSRLLAAWSLHMQAVATEKSHLL